MRKPFITEAMLKVYRNDRRIDELQERVIGCAYAMEQRRTAEREAAKRHSQELNTWAAIANRKLYEQHVWSLRRAWVDKVWESGLMTDRVELWDLAKLKYPMKD